MVVPRTAVFHGHPERHRPVREHGVGSEEDDEHERDDVVLGLLGRRISVHSGNAEARTSRSRPR